MGSDKVNHRQQLRTKDQSNNTELWRRHKSQRNRRHGVETVGPISNNTRASASATAAWRGTEQGEVLNIKAGQKSASAGYSISKLGALSAAVKSDFNH